MAINQTCPLIIHDLFSYDIVSAYPTIMNSLNWDFKGVDLDDKAARNISIGKAQINNENLSGFLMNSADQLVNFYLSENNISDDEIIITQRDGFIIKQMLDNNDEFIKMEFRGCIDFIIINMDRTMYLAISDDIIDIKGLPHNYPYLKKIYKKFIDLNFYNKKVLFSQLNSIKYDVLNGLDKKLYLIPRGDRFSVVTKSIGTIEISDEGIINIDEIDKYKYYKHYFKPFLDAIYLTCY
jgi:hypothetical protein